MEKEKINSIFFLGIGGIGMSALARYYHQRGVEVSGYDRTPTWLTQELITEGIMVKYNDRVAFPEKHYDLVVYTPAIPETNEQLRHYRSHGYRVVKRAEALADITRTKYTIAVAGTHGKTTISSMIAHILHSAGVGMTAFVGGICKNYNSNYISNSDNGVVIVEADEYDRSFLQLEPDLAIISSIDPDHLDIYETRDKLNQSFGEFAKKIHADGKLVVADGTRLELPKHVKTYTYSTSGNSDFTATDILDLREAEKFSIQSPGANIAGITLHMPGMHNISNAVAAAAVCSLYGLTEEQIRQGLDTYTGVRRRLDFRWRNGAVYIDDYAHHPRELSAAIAAVRRIYPGKRITGVFQPHLFSRTRDLADDFARSLEDLDELILLDIYPAREEPINGVNSEIIFSQIANPNKTIIERSQLMDLLWEKELEVLVTLGAGDIDQFVEPIEKMMQQRYG